VCTEHYHLGDMLGVPYSGKIWRAKNLANCSKSREN